MRWWQELKYVARKLNRRRAEQEAEEEIQTHLELETREKIEAGHSPEEARYAARRAFGSIVLAKEESRAVWGFGSLETWWQDLRYGARMLLRKPGFTLIAVTTLALGIGANSAIFSVVDGVLLRPLPYQDPDRLVMVWASSRLQGLEQIGASGPDFNDYSEQNQSFEKIAAYIPSFTMNLTGDGEPERIRATAISPDFFPLLGLRAILGRERRPEEYHLGAESTVMLSHGFWQRRYGGDLAVVGKLIQLNSVPHTIIGVMPPTLEDQQTDLWTALIPDYPWMNQRGNKVLRVIGRLKQGVSLAQAQTEMRAILHRVPGVPETNDVDLVPLQEQIVGSIRLTLLVLLGAVGCVLLIACANVASLLLARAMARQKEFAVRTAVGASRGRLIRQLLTENVPLALLGGVLGLLMALCGIDLLLALSPGSIPRLKEVSINGQVLGFTLILSVLTGVVFGLAPALQASRTDLNEALKEGHGSSTGHGPRDSSRPRLRGLLVVVEVALALVLLVGAGLLLKSFWRLQQVDPGFQPQYVLTAYLRLPNPYSTERKLAFYRALFERLGKLPGVQAVALTDALPLTGANTTSFTIEGRPEDPQNVPVAERCWISADYFRAMGIRLLRGRALTGSDVRSSPGVVVISEALAGRYFPDEDPLGKRLSIDYPPSFREIVGVVSNVKQRGLDIPERAALYVPYVQDSSERVLNGMHLVLRTTSSPLSLAQAVRSEIRGLDKDLPIQNLRGMEELLSASVARRRFNLLLLGIFAGVALLLAAAGIYGVMAYAVSQRTHEIGIRVALGAQTRDVLKLVVGQGMQLALTGVALGLAAALAVTRVLSGLVFGVSVTDPTTFAVIALFLIGVVLLACYLPARRATKVDAMIALRYE